MIIVVIIIIIIIIIIVIISSSNFIINCINNFSAQRGKAQKGAGKTPPTTTEQEDVEGEAQCPHGCCCGLYERRYSRTMSYNCRDSPSFLMLSGGC